MAYVVSIMVCLLFLLWESNRDLCCPAQILSYCPSVIPYQPQMKIFVPFFSVILKCRELKVGTYLDSEWMYRVNDDADASSCISPFSLLGTKMPFSSDSTVAGL